MDAAALLEAARTDLARGWSVRAGTRLRQAAEAGSTEALDELVSALLEGRIPGGVREARRRLEAAADANPRLRMLRAGLRYAGAGGASAPREALDDLARAAEGGLPAAAIELALAWLEHGARGQAVARGWLTQAAGDSPLARELLDYLPAGEADAAPPFPDDWAVFDPAEFEREPLSADPRIERFREALTPIECAWLRASAQTRLAPSLVADPRTGTARADPVRTGQTMCFSPAVPGVFARRLAARLAALAGRDLAAAEPLAVLRYRPGQEYKAHHDWLGSAALARDPLREAGERIATVLGWLNVPEAGGATLFPRLDLRVEPVLGDVLAFANIDAAGAPAEHSFHAGEPVTAGEKWLASLWIRARPVRI